MMNRTLILINKIYNNNNFVFHIYKTYLIFKIKNKSLKL